MVSSTKMPKNWKKFLRVNENKTELFAFLSSKAESLSIVESKELYTTDGSGVLCSPTRLHHAYLVSRSQREADTRLLLHTADAARIGHNRVTICTVDTDVVVLAVATFSKIAPTEMWIAFGVGYRYLPIHEMVAKVNPTRCFTLPVFHAFSGICFCW